MKDRPRLSIEEYDKLEEELFDQGFLTQEYVPVTMPITKRTTVKCPICNSYITTYSCGNSYGITCETKDCLSDGLRGI